jgi:hypothetical protein
MNASFCKQTLFIVTALLFCSLSPAAWSQTQAEDQQDRPAGTASPDSSFQLRPLGENKIISKADCTAAKLGSNIPASSIGEPVSGLTLDSPEWTEGAGSNPAYCIVNGSMAPVSAEAGAKPIHFRVVLPAAWSRRAAQFGGAGMNGSIPNLLGGADMGPGPSLVELGFATYGSDSGHQMGIGGFGFGGGRGKSPAGKAAPNSNDWALNDEAIKNLGYMQLKKTHDAAMVLIVRMYGETPRFNYFFGSSQGGREALTVAQRYPADYNGVAAGVPVLNFSSQMLSRELIRIQEKPLANWVTPQKVNAIRGEFMRQCDRLDGLLDGIINNYMACRAIFNVKQGEPGRDPWAAKRCPDNKDPNPDDTSANACLTEGQIATLQFVYSPYRFATPLANGVESFGMLVPNTDPSGSGLIAPSRFRGQEGADDGAPLFTNLGILGVTGFLMQDLNANPLDYIEGGRFEARRHQLSEWMDSTDPNLDRFSEHGGKMIVAIGTNDTLGSPGAQLDYYQSVLDTMGREKVDGFARFFVLPQTGHGLSGTSYSVDGEGKPIQAAPIPNAFSRFELLVDWVEKTTAPPMAVTVKAGDRSLPMCSYPAYPKYLDGPTGEASSYTCTLP